MDVRHGFCQPWRRASPAPVGVRTCTAVTTVPPAQRRTVPTRRAAQWCLSASSAMAIDSIATATAEPGFFAAHEEVPCESPSHVSSPDAACPAVLQTRLSKAHSSAASAALVVQDTPDEKLVATASLDKGMAIWRFYSSQGEGENTDTSCEESIEVTRLKVPGAPVFSLAKIPDVLPDGTIIRKRHKPSGIYLGTASKEVLTWMLGSKDVTDKVVLGGHTGWVRSLAVTGKWLFSCGCNCLRLWDTTFRTPKESQVVRLFTGDILAIEASDGRVFTAGADGSLRSWAITRAGGLEEGPWQERAHEGRVSALVVDGARVFTVSYDGSVKAWSASTLQLLAEARGAHLGEKVFCVTMGPNGVLFTGGDDKLIRAWDLDLNPVGLPLDGHAAAVRVLSAGRRATLVSGDADGDVCIWETYPVDLPPPKPLPEDMAEGSVAMGSEAAAAAGVEAAASSVEVAMGEAALQQLETMFAAEPQAEQQGGPEAAGVEESFCEPPAAAGGEVRMLSDDLVIYANGHGANGHGANGHGANGHGGAVDGAAADAHATGGDVGTVGSQGVTRKAAPHSRRLEVESVAAAVAAACLTLEADGRSFASAVHLGSS